MDDKRVFFTLLVLLIMLVSSPVLGQVFLSGSTGTLGALNPTTDITVTLPPDGVLNYTTITVPFGWICGTPPITEELGAELTVHVLPPSFETESFSRFPMPKSSHVT